MLGGSLLVLELVSCSEEICASFEAVVEEPSASAEGLEPAEPSLVDPRLLADSVSDFADFACNVRGVSSDWTGAAAVSFCGRDFWVVFVGIASVLVFFLTKPELNPSGSPPILGGLAGPPSGADRNRPGGLATLKFACGTLTPTAFVGF